MTAKLDPRTARQHLQEFRFADLFVEDLGWNYLKKERQKGERQKGANVEYRI